MLNIYKSIADLSYENGMSIVELGRLSGVCRTSLDGIRLGKNPQINTLAKIAKVLHVKTSELIAKAESYE